MGFYVELPEPRKKDLPDVVGPIVRLGTCSASQWKAMIMIAVRSHTRVTFSWGVEGHQAMSQVAQEDIDESGEWKFVRFPIAVPLQAAAQVASYEIETSTNIIKASIPVPAAQQDWNLTAYSCYDQRRAIGEALWYHMAEKALTTPLHAILGGGDQLYNDNLWALPLLDAWLQKPKEERLKYQPTKEESAAVEEYYRNSYLSHIHFHPVAGLLRALPQVNTWDDHDIFDGWGSYPPEVQMCPMFQMVFEQSHRFYLLCQHGTTSRLAAGDGYVVNPGNSTGQPRPAVHYVAQLGPSVFVVAPDSRSQRSRERIIRPESMERINVAIKGMAKTTQHLILLSAIPIVYPKLGVLETLLKSFEGASKTTEAVLFKTGLYDKIFNHFGEPDLLDDVTDHWSSGTHEAEKAELLGMFRDVANSRRVRVTIISGDVHLGAFTFLKSAGKEGNVQASDPGFMPQIVTSGIGNKPPADFVVKYVESCGKKPRKVAEGLLECVGTLFSDIKTQTGSKSFNSKMNYVEIGAQKASMGDAIGLRMNYVFLGGDQIEGKTVGDQVESMVPPLLPAGAPDAAALTMPGAVVPTSGMRKCLCCGAP